MGKGIRVNPIWSEVGSMKGSHVKELDDPNFMCVDFVPKYCDNHVLEFSSPAIQYQCSSCHHSASVRSLEKMSMSSDSSTVYLNPADI